MCSECWKWLSLFDSRAIVERCRREFKKNFLCFLGNRLELVMHVRIILEMVACYLHFNEKFLYAHQATDWFIQEREKVQELHYLLSRSANKDSVLSHCKKLLVLQCLLAITILPIFFGKVDVEVDTTSRKAYCHHPLISQEQPLSMRIPCVTYPKSYPYGLFPILKSDLYLMADRWLF
jgi:hypothetical protein